MFVCVYFFTSQLSTDDEPNFYDFTHRGSFIIAAALQASWNFRTRIALSMPLQPPAEWSVMTMTFTFN